MRPGDKTRAPLRTRELDQRAAPPQLRLTVVFHPDRERIGASLKLGALNASGVLHLDATTLGRNAPLFEDCSDTEIEEALGAVGPNLSALSQTLRLSKASIASRLRLMGVR